MLITPKGHGLGWRRQLPDHRDHIYAAPPPIIKALPSYVDLRKTGFLLPPFDQLQTSSCVGQSTAGALAFARAKEKLGSLVPSRLQIYYDARLLEGTASIDGGAEIRDAFKAMAAQGATFETGSVSWPFIPANVTVRPPAVVYAAALKDRALSYQTVAQDINQIRGCLADGHPFVFGFTVFESFESDHVAATGRVPMPSGDDAPIGGHAVLAIGYDDTDRNMLVRNSWGAGWGIKGNFLLPYEYVINPNLASDFWTLRTAGI